MLEKSGLKIIKAFLTIAKAPESPDEEDGEVRGKQTLAQSLGEDLDLIRAGGIISKEEGKSSWSSKNNTTKHS